MQENCHFGFLIVKFLSQRFLTHISFSKILKNAIFQTFGDQISEVSLIPRSKLIYANWSSVRALKSHFYSIGAILSDYFVHILIGIKIAFLTDIVKVAMLF